jgi:hypothetical protein
MNYVHIFETKAFCEVSHILKNFKPYPALVQTRSKCLNSSLPQESQYNCMVFFFDMPSRTAADIGRRLLRGCGEYSQNCKVLRYRRHDPSTCIISSYVTVQHSIRFFVRPLKLPNFVHIYYVLKWGCIFAHVNTFMCVCACL